MELKKIGPGFAVELRGVTIHDVIEDNDAYKAVRAAFEEHSVVLLRDQPRSGELHVAFTRAFGPLEKVKSTTLGAGSHVARFTNLGPDGAIVPMNHRNAITQRANELWHTDSTFLPHPGLASVMVTDIIPEQPVSQNFVSTRQAWERLPQSMKERLRKSFALHSYAASRDKIEPNMLTPEERAKLPPQKWRMSWRNPVNGSESFYVASYVFGVEGMPDQEAQELVAELIEGATKPEYVYTHTWEVGDVLIWDNRATMHRAEPWPWEFPHGVARTTVVATEADGVAEMRAPTA